MPRAAREWIKHRMPELALAVLALTVFAGFLGEMELWGKREQRSVAETLDTVDGGNWLVAHIQGRPRLEKPPLPRWTIAALMKLTGLRNEWVVRVPGVLSALGMVALTYSLARRIGGRSCGIAAGLAFCAMPFGISELRQAGNDGPLAFFTTLAVYSAWRRLHGNGQSDGQLLKPAQAPGHEAWVYLGSVALGLGFLTKGPIILALVSLAILPYLIVTRRLKAGLKALMKPGAIPIFLVIALSWPVPVMLADPNAVRIWMLEMGQKAGTLGIHHHREHQILALEWFWMTAPWCMFAGWAAIRPIVRRSWEGNPALSLIWSWAVLNLIMFCFWTVAKPNYYLPCLPAVAILAGCEWLRLAPQARELSRKARHARRFLVGHWVVLFVAAALVPVVVSQLQPRYFLPSMILCAAGLTGVIVSFQSWRRGFDVSAFAALMAPFAVTAIVAYGLIIPDENPSRSHRQLAATVDELVSKDVQTVLFFQELDEGMWFYLKNRQLKAVPGSNPQYNEGYDLLREYWSNTLVTDPQARLNLLKQPLLRWLDDSRRESSYVLMRTSRYDAFAADLSGRVEVLYRENDMNRNSLVLLRAKGSGSDVSTTIGGDSQSLLR